MKFEEIAEKAFKQKDLPKTANLAEKYAYMELYYLYRDYRKTLIDKEIATNKKTQIQNEFNKNQKKVNDYYEVFKNQNGIRKKYYEYITAIEKSKTQDEILDNSLKFIENIIQDNTFYDRQTKKIDN